MVNFLYERMMVLIVHSPESILPLRPLARRSLRFLRLEWVSVLIGCLTILNLQYERCMLYHPSVRNGTAKSLLGWLGVRLLLFPTLEKIRQVGPVAITDFDVAQLLSV